MEVSSAAHCQSGGPRSGRSSIGFILQAFPAVFALGAATYKSVRNLLMVSEEGKEDGHRTSLCRVRARPLVAQARGGRWSGYLAKERIRTAMGAQKVSGDGGGLERMLDFPLRLEVITQRNATSLSHTSLVMFQFPRHLGREQQPESLSDQSNAAPSSFTYTPNKRGPSLGVRGGGGDWNK